MLQEDRKVAPIETLSDHKRVVRVRRADDDGVWRSIPELGNRVSCPVHSFHSPPPRIRDPKRTHRCVHAPTRVNAPADASRAPSNIVGTPSLRTQPIRPMTALKRLAQGAAVLAFVPLYLTCAACALVLMLATGEEPSTRTR